jgi:hypothetical protein
MDEIREQTRSLNDELTQGAPATCGDRTDEMLRAAQRELERISRELETPVPGK